MIVLDHVTKRVVDGVNVRNVVDSSCANIPSDRIVALLGRSEEDKKIFIDLLAGVDIPTSGRIEKTKLVSFPPWHMGPMTQEISVRANVAHLARIYDANVEELVEFVERSLDIGQEFDRLYRDLSRGIRKPLFQILVLSLPFHVYLLNDDFVRGEEKYVEKCRSLFEARRQTSGFVIQTRSQGFAQTYCNMGIVLDSGQLTVFDSPLNALAATRALGIKVLA